MERRGRRWRGLEEIGGNEERMRRGGIRKGKGWSSTCLVAALQGFEEFGMV